jgi:hypothetical protein
MKVVGIFFASPTSISTETHQHSRQSVEVKLEEKQQRFSRLKFLQNVGQELHELNAAADERS